ncbi:hypothetical protein FD754_017126 [Muntiacus muntjak]|uniref:Uncharacterized protein n=1 Tax=Muntiacus muntjak TaxID=9888 RepID=A0A5N3VSE8_MUNMU|nr:hypothetical protein FD754_017126 [Muntiacus muntjak]
MASVLLLKRPGLLQPRNLFAKYIPSQANTAVFEAVLGPPPASLCHDLWWYNHIKSYEKEK